MEDGSGVRVAERCDENVLLARLRLWEKRAVPQKTCRNPIQFCVCVCAWENPFSPRVPFPAPTRCSSPFPSAYRFINACKRLLSFTHSFIHSFVHSFICSFDLCCAILIWFPVLPMKFNRLRLNDSLNESLINDDEYHFFVMIDFWRFCCCFYLVDRSNTNFVFWQNLSWLQLFYLIYTIYTYIILISIIYLFFLLCIL